MLERIFLNGGSSSCNDDGGKVSNLTIAACLCNNKKTMIPGTLTPYIVHGLGFPLKIATRMMSNGTYGPFMIGIAGGTASGKTSVCKKIMEQLGEAIVSADKRKVVCIVQDCFYRKLSPEESADAALGLFNFDHPSALDMDLMKNVLDDLMHNRMTQVPVYDFTKNAPKENEFEKIYPADVVLVEGILSFYFPEIRDLFQMKIFVDTDSDVRLCRRIQRDVGDRGRDINTILNQYMATVKPSFEDFCLPTKKYADVVIPRGSDNTVAVGLIVQHIKEVLAARNGNGTHASGMAGRPQAGISRSGLH